MKPRKQLLYITPVLPLTADSGGLIVTLDRLDTLSRHFDVTVLAIEASDAAIERHTSGFNLKSVVHGGGVKPRTAKNWLKSLLAGMPLSIWRNMPAAFMALADSLATKSFDLTYVDHWLMWPAAERIRHPGRRILHLHNAEHLLFSRSAAQASFLIRQVLQIEAQRAGAYLRKICRQADEVHCLSPLDAEEIYRLGGIMTPCNVFQPWIPLPEGEFGKAGSNVLFVGTMTWAPNANGIRWYLSEVGPHLPSNCRTDIVGGFLDPSIQSSSTDRIIWHGRVPELEPFYRAASVFIAPLKAGSGIKIKLLNALAHGIPVVTTSVGVEGFPPGWDHAITVADDGPSFAAAIAKLCSDRQTWQRAVDATRPYLTRHFSPDGFTAWTQNIAAYQAKSSPSQA